MNLLKNKMLVIIPMKDPSNSKTRLKKVLSNDFRKKLSLKLFYNTLKVLKKSCVSLSGFIDLAVVTESSQISEIASNKNIKVLNSSKIKTLSEILNFSADWAYQNSYSKLCIIPADLVNPKESDFKSLLSFQLKLNTMVISPSKDLGTNALLISPVNGIKFNYGPKSFLKHQEIAKRKGLSLILMPLPSFYFDLDTSDDLEEVLIKYPNFLDNKIKNA